MNQIRKALDMYSKLSDKNWLSFASMLKKKIVVKKILLLKEGQIENNLSFIEEGIIRFYIPKGEKEDLTFGFTFTNSFVSGYDSFITQEPSVYNLEALTPCILWSINYKDLQEIYKKTDVGNTIGRLAAEGLFLQKAKRELSLLNETATQRYLRLLKEEPHFIKHIPQKYIASFIGITPQALSRIRRDIS